jgi:hypothetical protein
MQISKTLLIIYSWMPVSLNGLECRVSESANRDTRSRPTTQEVAAGHAGGPAPTVSVSDLAEVVAEDHVEAAREMQRGRRCERPRAPFHPRAAGVCA